MNINKALKLKNKLTRELLEISQNIQKHNRSKTDKFAYDIKQLLDDYFKKQTEIINLKVAINNASVGAYKYIQTIAETKGNLTMLARINTEDGPDAYHDKISYTVALTHHDIDTLKKANQELLESNQEALEDYNFKTNIDWK